MTFTDITTPAFMQPAWVPPRAFCISRLEVLLSGGSGVTGETTVQLVLCDPRGPWFGYTPFAEAVLADGSGVDLSETALRAVEEVYDGTDPYTIPAGSWICAIHDRPDFEFPDGSTKSTLSVIPHGTYV